MPAGELMWLTEVSGSHRLDGIFVMAGPGVQRGAELDTLSIMDVAPTVLYGLGMPVASDLDGRLVAEAFGPEWRASHPMARIASYEPVRETSAEPEALTEDQLAKLRSLGYLAPDSSAEIDDGSDARAKPPSSDRRRPSAD